MTASKKVCNRIRFIYINNIAHFFAFCKMFLLKKHLFGIYDKILCKLHYVNYSNRAAQPAGPAAPLPIFRGPHPPHIPYLRPPPLPSPAAGRLRRRRDILEKNDTFVQSNKNLIFHFRRRRFLGPAIPANSPPARPHSNRTPP